MTIILRTVAVLVALPAVWATWFLVLVVRAESLAFAEAALTIGALLLVATASGVAAVQLWRLRRTGLDLTVTLCAMVVLYFILTIVSDAPLVSALPGLCVAVALLVVLLSPAARKACIDG